MISSRTAKLFERNPQEHWAFANHLKAVAAVDKARGSSLDADRLAIAREADAGS